METSVYVSVTSWMTGVSGGVQLRQGALGPRVKLVRKVTAPLRSCIYCVGGYHTHRSIPQGRNATTSGWPHEALVTAGV